MSERKPRGLIIRRVNLVWYPLTLLPIAVLVGASALGYLPIFVGMLALFLLFFWLFSLGFALYAKFRKRKEKRQ